eukprot:CAMPEP_0173170490 /NCGR_PEP_ID=MMETSP1141-20130122/1261_1 /TAXON_ID=483371 /ORGANISM="non described non described, Strain CCMP2298" /LENGTH=123 /DNA_ID=CAMNT_0014092379 /DNA_START=17 /DNA_END=385 /DNA_ORIENTATION=-
MDIDAFLNSIPKPIIVLCLLAFFIMKVMWSAVGTGVKTVTSMEDWTGVMEEAGDRLVVVYCHSAYCKMRKTAGALFSQWSKEYPGATFVKVYVQTAKLIPEIHGIRTTPSYVLMRGGRQLALV